MSDALFGKRISDFTSRFESKVGVREDAEFFGPGPSKMFGLTYIPSGHPTAGVVICCPLQAEFMRNYRKEVLLARSLAAAGLAVQRFHYRGSGNSEGKLEEATFETLRDDALAATERLVQKTGISSLVFVGARFGGLVAVAAAKAFEGMPVVLWEPVVDPSTYFRDVFRSHLIRKLKEAHQGSTSTETLIEEMRQAGSVKILGWSIGRAIFESAQGHSLEGELGAEPRPIFLIQIGGRDFRSEYATLVTRWNDMDFLVDVHLIAEPVAWWFFDGRWQPEETRDSTRVLLDRTTDWILGHVSRG